MRTLQEHLDDLDRMVDNGADKPKVRSQVAFIGREVAALETDYARLAADHAKLQEAHTKLQNSQSYESQDLPMSGGQPRMIGRMEW